MHSKPNPVEKELHMLERIRQNLGRKLDAIYAKDDVFGTIVLESKYQKVAHRIEQLRTMTKTARALV